MLHHVRPFQGEGFAPNRLLEVEPAFLDAALIRVRALGYELVSMDAALARIGDPEGRPFVALTFDDGYVDTATHALPILERHAAPFTLYVTTGFAERGARLWWLELELAIRALPRIEVEIDGRRLALPARDDDEKNAAFRTLYWMLRAGPEARLLDVVAALAAQAGVDAASIPAKLCLDWDGIARLARHPLCTIGAHTAQPPDAGEARRGCRTPRTRREPTRDRDAHRPARAPPRLSRRRSRLRRSARARDRRRTWLCQRRDDAARAHLSRASRTRDRAAAAVAQR